MLFIFLSFSLFLCSVECAVIPAYLTACSLSDPEFEKCALASANGAISHYINGDKSIKLLSLKPHKTESLQVEASESLSIKLTDVSLIGFETMILNKISIDPVKKHWNIQGKFDLIQLLSVYDMNGRIMILPIAGNGNCNITMIDVDFEYNLDYELKKKNEEDFANIIQSNVKYDAERIYFQFDNLFNGDKRLGTEMNIFLNENWKEVSQEVYKGISMTIGSVVTLVLQKFFKSIPYSQLVRP